MPNTKNICIVVIIIMCCLYLFLIYFKTVFVHSYSYHTYSLKKQNKLRILLLNAHPDDETLFGSRDFIENNCTVICFTHGEDLIRRAEFFRAIEYTDNSGYIYNFPDSRGEISQDELYKIWYNLSNKDIYEKYIKPLLKGEYDMVVSHSKTGEYGHVIHKRMHEIAKYTSEEINVPFNDFQNRFNKNNTALRNNILQIYKSQNINKYRDFYDRFSPSDTN
jgi:LmbE family N-acetylglucosaminyl deacetylase